MTSPLGCASDSWRDAQAWFRNLRSYRAAVNAKESPENNQAVLEKLLEEPVPLQKPLWASNAS